ncbi:efflux RND transporter periplasmic adaptor subunit [Thalassotalea sp. HSM 43]|uniref:efflux RND transporter periplasmic adaptor subunit n=1 Tax=Thalassotalea sp. HSM 43 TaxID=2552945 RepID=UPI00107FF1CF|nr:efflux RND transporter periplasmic adaptor subunit [Thalassotalea sp. HSM 43]QBY04749.1 efflux RND transporter periplasmic adaptor subunit [Thalassotalea sp. HSM 43]
MAAHGQNNRSNSSSSLLERPYLLAILICLLLIVWLVSGIFNVKQNPDTSISKNIPPAKVKVETFYAEQVENSVTLYGRTEPDRHVTLQAQVKGEITEVLASRGSFVNKGDVIAKIALNDLPAQLEHFRTLLKQRRVDYYGAKELFKGGYQNESALAQRLADVTEAKADLARIELDMANTTIVAPFDGILNERYVEVGDYVAIGEDIAMVADLDPLVIRAHITENQIPHIREGQTADITLLNKQRLTGKVRYIASVANESTNTFKAEIAIDNPDLKYLAGISSEVDMPMAMVPAIKLTPALLALDEVGNIGVKSVVDDHVVFTQIQIVKSEEDGIWLTGLGEQQRIITLGQGFVRPGDKVEAVEAND